MANTKIKNRKKSRICLDVMGGDFAPINEIKGAIDFFEEDELSNLDLEIVFVGNEKKINAALNQFDYSKLKYSVVHTDEVITMHDEPTAALKSKKNSSLYKGLEMHKQGYVDAFISAGNTGAVLSTATVLLGRIQGVSRPTIGSFIPTQKKNPVFLLDVGANTICKPIFLYEFAVMASIQVRNMLGLENPRIALLNIGEETTKGTETIQEAHKLLSESQLNFIGNVEGRDILSGIADIIVCDGFTGNIVLKFAESFKGFFKTKVMDFGKKSIFNMMSLVFMKPIIKKIFAGFDYQEYGGVPLLGVNGNVIIGHGKSSPKAIKYMIHRAVAMNLKGINSKIETAFSTHNVKEKENKI